MPEADNEVAVDQEFADTGLGQGTDIGDILTT